MKKNEVSVSLNIYGYEDNVQHLTTELGLNPDKALNKGQPLFSGAGPIPQSIWELKSKLPASASVEDHVNSLLELIRPQRENIARIAQQYRTVISVGAHYTEKNPEIELESSILRDMGELNISLWLDIYR